MLNAAQIKANSKIEHFVVIFIHFGIRIPDAVHVSAFTGRRTNAPEPPSFSVQGALHHALIEHRIGDFYKSGDIRTYDEIARLPIFGGSFPRIFKNHRHDVMQT